MFKIEEYRGNLGEKYSKLIYNLYEICNDETNYIANLSNASALLNNFLENINWVGFYLYDENIETLILGPFQGLPACKRIKNGFGVCGSAVKENKTKRISNVHEFEGHIACDENSKSEIVIPIYKNNKIFGVLDIDSPIYDRFSSEEQLYLEEFVKELQKHI